MKRWAFLAGMLALLGTGTSCHTVTLGDQPVLSRTAMRFDAVGARVAECSLVGQVEKGRSFSNSTAGGGCASCR